MNLDALRTENARRNARLDAPYDPVAGIGCVGERVEVSLFRGETQLVPLEMAGAIDPVIVEKGLAAYAAGRDMYEGHAKRQWHHLRAKYDFEYWCATDCYIMLDADTAVERGEAEDKFVLNKAQVYYWSVVRDQIKAGIPIRIILLKARQWGGSTMTQALICWIQLYHREAWNAFICTLSVDQGFHIRGMYSTMARHHVGLTMKGYEGSTNVRRVDEHKGLIGVTSLQQPDKVRGYPIHMAHLSEVGLWKSTPVVNAEEYARAIVAAVPKRPYTCIILESTAKGVGNFFHDTWEASGRGDSVYEQVFVPWFDIPKYRDPFPEDRWIDALESADEYSKWLWEVKECSLEQIAWYNAKLQEYSGDREAMQSEYPSEPEEAFQSTGSAYFTKKRIAEMRSDCREPVFRGRIKGDAEEGKGALSNLRLIEDPNGPLKIWHYPDDNPKLGDRYALDSNLIYSNRYVGFADFGGKTKKADWSVLTILDRAPTLLGEPLRVSARLRMHTRPDIFGWESVRVAKFYYEALLAYEINRHKHDRGDVKRGFEPEWSLAVLETIMNHYRNLYMRETNRARTDDSTTSEIGFHMNISTKPMICALLDRCIDEYLLDDPDETAVNEMSWFEKKEDGTLGAVEGKHDDCVVTDAGAVWLAIKYLRPFIGRPPYRVPQQSGASAAFV